MLFLDLKKTINLKIGQSLKWFMLPGFLLWGIVGSFWFFNLRLNLTPSMPLGIWRETNYLGSVDNSTMPCINPRFSVLRCSHTKTYAPLRCSKIKCFCGGLANCQQTLEKNAFIIFCLPHNNLVASLIKSREYLPHGQCKNGFSPLLKKIIAVTGDVVDLNMHSIVVNGKQFYHSATLMTDSKLRLMPHIPRGRYIVAEDEYWVLATDHPRSLDSRYFGPIPKNAILHIMKPVAIFYQYHFS